MKRTPEIEKPDATRKRTLPGGHGRASYPLSGLSIGKVPAAGPTPRSSNRPVPEEPERNR
jgi:hypothetical protein